MVRQIRDSHEKKEEALEKRIRELKAVVKEMVQKNEKLSSAYRFVKLSPRFFQTFVWAIGERNSYPVVKYQGNSCFNHRIEIYPLDNVIHLLKNRGRLVCKVCPKEILFLGVLKRHPKLETGAKVRKLQRDWFY